MFKSFGTAYKTGKNVNSRRTKILKNSVADPGCLSGILDLNFSFPDPGYKRFQIPDPDPHQRI